VAHREPVGFTHRLEANPVIRGGCWISLQEMLRTSFRGKDLLTDRHFEIGFRCVVKDEEERNRIVWSRRRYGAQPSRTRTPSKSAEQGRGFCKPAPGLNRTDVSSGGGP
jgi:hypothetical protein